MLSKKEKKKKKTASEDAALTPRSGFEPDEHQAHALCACGEREDVNYLV